MKKILLVNGWSDDNKGDCAIVEGLINKIEEVDKDIVLNLNSTLDLDGFSDKYHYRHTKKIEGFSTSTFVKKSGKVIKLINIMYSFILLMVPSLHRNALYKKFLRNFASEAYCNHLDFFYDADMVISKGGHILVANNGIGGLLTLYKNIYPILMGIRLKKVTIIFSQSIGPFESKLSTLLASYTFNRVDKILCREKKTHNLVKNLVSLKCKDNVKLTWDTAFSVVPKYKVDRIEEKYNSEEYFGVTIRKWDFSNNKDKKKSGYKEYIDGIVDSIKYLEEKYGLKALIIPQVTGPIEFEDDRLAIEELKEVLENEGVQAEYLHGDYSPSELSYIYGKCKFVIGTRFHSVILSLVSGTPAIAISYYGYKTLGIMSMFELSNYVVDINNIDKADIRYKIDDLLSNIEEKKSIIRHKVDEANELIKGDIECILKES